MKKNIIYSVIAIIFGLVFVMPGIMAGWNTGAGVGANISVGAEDFAPKVWMCDSRVVYDDATAPGRVSADGTTLVERINNYAFEGEQIKWNVLVMDKNGINDIKDVYGTVGNSPGAGNDAEVNCVEDLNHPVAAHVTCTVNGGVNVVCSLNGVSATGAIGATSIVINGTPITLVWGATSVTASATIGGNSDSCTITGLVAVSDSGSCSFTIDDAFTNVIDSSCNARIDEESLTTYNPSLMRYYTCTLSVETASDMSGPYWLTVEAIDNEGNSVNMDENEFWYLNPVIAIGIGGNLLNFPNGVRPGTDAYSESALIYNDAESDSGVMMDMFISGTDFYDSSPTSMALCPTSNQLTLDHFRYYATNGAYSTQSAYGASYLGPGKDSEGYKGIIYGVGFNNPTPFYNRAEILPVQQVGSYYAANILAPGSHMALTFKLSLPEPCNGDFDTGSIYFWGEAI